jgi:uncharacterized membrane protein YkvA (DUF1232 family)
MADKKSGNLMVTPQSGVIHNIMVQAKLIVRLIGDKRVSAWAKLIPIGALIYVISPVDLIPGIAFPVVGALDDAAVLGLGTYIFLELCPPAVVQEHTKALNSNMDTVESNDEVVDGETTDVTDKKE